MENFGRICETRSNRESWNQRRGYFNIYRFIRRCRGGFTFPNREFQLSEGILLLIPTCSQVKPSIHQINLSACCVVPEDLQIFCKEHDIRILTHNDPSGKISVTIVF